jgi:hypothetical protein
MGALFFKQKKKGWGATSGSVDRSYKYIITQKL